MAKIFHNPYSIERNYYKTKEQENSVCKFLTKGYEIVFTEYKENDLLYYMKHLDETVIINSNGFVLYLHNKK